MVVICSADIAPYKVTNRKWQIVFVWLAAIATPIFLDSLEMPFYAIDEIKPVVSQHAYVHPTATIIGDVIIGPNCYVGPSAVLRGDFGRLILEEGSNLQDTCVMHGFPENDTIVEKDGHIGHGAVLHGCIIKRNALIGMNAVIMDGAVIGEDSIVGAMSFVKESMQIPSRKLAAGSPAKVIRELSDEEIEWKSKGTHAYQTLTHRSLTSMVKVEPLSEPEENRKRLKFEGLSPLQQFKSDTK